MVYQHIYKMWLFSLVERYGNFKEAANHANITRSALSQNLSVLENYLNKSLLVRERGSVSLTADGQSLLDKIQPILSQADDLAFNFSEESELKGSFKLGAYESLAVRFLPKLFTSFRRIYPNFKIDVVTSRTDSLVKLVNNGTLNMALVINGEGDSKIEEETVMVDSLGLYVCADKYCYTQDIEEIKEMGIAILSTPEDGQPYYYKKFLQKIPDDFKVTLTCDNFEVIRSITASGAVVGLLPTKVASQSSYELKKIWPTEEDIVKVSEHRVSLVYRKNTDKRIINLIKKVVLVE